MFLNTTDCLDLVVAADHDPVLERALFFAEVEFLEATVSVPQALWSHCLAAC
jgi:hypothetical protein